MSSGKLNLSALNQLVCIPIRIENYVELRINDDFTTPIFQYRLEQHCSSPWKEPRKPIKSKLYVNYTSLCLTTASWWPYRNVQRIEFRMIERLITFSQETTRFAIGIQDDDCAEKQFVIMSTKKMLDLEKLLHVMNTQLLIWKHHSVGSGSESAIPSEFVSLPSMKTNQLANELAQAMSSECALFEENANHSRLGRIHKPLVQKYQPTTHSQFVVMTNGFQNNSLNLVRNALTKPNTQASSFQTEQQQQQQQQQPIYRPRSVMSMGSEPKRTKDQSSQSNLNPSFKLICPNRELENKRDLQTNNRKSWEVDIKHVRYDPLLGNVVDDEGPVYLYTAHEVT